MANWTGMYIIDNTWQSNTTSTVTYTPQITVGYTPSKVEIREDDLAWLDRRCEEVIELSRVAA